MTAPLLSVEALSKHYGLTPVLRDVDLTVEPGEFVILIGGSGSGKTTLLRVVGGLERADAGRVTLRGKPVDAPAFATFVPPERRGLGMVFQDYALWPHMNCLENVEAAVRGRGASGIARDLLDELGVGALARRRPAQLSGGQQQRVGLARALATRTDLLLLDEPLSSLDVDIRERMRGRIRAAVRQHGAAALFVSHDPVDAWRLADRVAVLEEGRVVQAATPEQLYHRPATARVARFTDAIGGLKLREVFRAKGSAAFDWGGQPQEGIVGATLETGGAVRAYVRPCGVQAAETGEPARLLSRTFEAGAWRSTWHVPAHDWTLCGLETAPPPAQTRLRLCRDHVFLFPEKDGL